jgi:hypothetical protein
MENEEETDGWLLNKLALMGEGTSRPPEVILALAGVPPC